MGKQVEFFMTIEDEQDFLIGLDQFGPVKIIYNTFADQSKMQIDTLPPVGTTVYDADLSLLNPQISRSIKQKFVPSQNCYWTDVSESEVVQFNRCRMVKDWLASGRLVRAVSKVFDEKCGPKGTQPVSPVIEEQIATGQWAF